MTDGGRADQQSDVRYCDLVMKGGITSGLVYPRAVARIGEHYRFRNIGGTSAGAIAAALSAAAALGERRIAAGQSSAGGLVRLRQTADDLAKPGFIFGLFQPVRKARAAFALLVKFAADPGASSIPLVLRASLLAPVVFFVALLLPEAIGFAIGGLRGVLAAALPSLLLAIAAAIAGAIAGVARTIRANFLGMCPGLRQAKGAPLGLSEWMHEEIRALAGFGEGDGPPVTFGDLWTAPLYVDEAPGEVERVLNLEVITTDVSHSEPRTLPFMRGSLWFREQDMARLFPATVVQAMVANGQSLNEDGIAFRAFPEAVDLPIVVAARMSLSFPLLISAVPLFEQHFLRKDDRTRPAAGAEENKSFAETVEELASTAEHREPDHATFEMRACWFTDGGVSSNFPIHLFDAPMPRWPTFALDLVYPPTGTSPDKDPIFLPRGNNEGWRPRYTSIARRAAVKEIGAFLTAIISTMQNWRDLLQGRAPGHRDRIVQVSINPDEGGMQLNMPDSALVSLAEKGEQAGDKLIEAFSFENHFWVRYRNLQAALERFGLRLDAALASAPEGAENAYRCAKEAAGDPPSYKYSAEQAKEAAHRLNDLLQEFETWEDWEGSLTKDAPNPPPHLRIVPIF